MTRAYRATVAAVLLTAAAVLAAALESRVQAAPSAALALLLSAQS